MRVIVNDIAASSGGAMTVLREFYETVKKEDTQNEWIFLLSGDYLEPTDRISILTFPEVKKHHTKKLVFDFFTGKNIIRRLNPDIIFSLQNTYTYGLEIPQIIYIHQPLPFQDIKHFSFLKPRERKIAVCQYLIGTVIKKSAAKAQKIIVQTEWMKKAICKKCRLPENNVVKIRPVAECGERNYDVEFDKTSFFYPTSDYLYKNNDCFIKAAQILAAKGEKIKAEITLESNQSIENVNFTGQIDHNRVLRKYRQSTLVFPSYIESFGYPLAEARKAGTVILASDSDFSHEILEGYENAYYFKPDDPSALADLMLKVSGGVITKKAVLNSCDNKNSWTEVLKEIVGFESSVSDKHTVTLQG